MDRPRTVLLVALVTCAVLVHAHARAPEPVDLLVTGGTVITMDPGRRVLTPGAVAVGGADIVAVGSPDELRQAYTPRRVIDATGRVVMPGLINTHGHAPMVMYRGLADDLALMDWLQQYIFPAEAKTVAPAFVRAGTELAALEMSRSGTTTYVDMYYFEEEIARATRAAGLRGVLGQTVIGFPSPDAKTPADALSRTERFLHEFADDPLITPAVAPHSMYLVDKAVLLACRALAVKHQKPLLIHLAETEDEIKIARERFQTSPTAFLQQIGFWAPRTLAAHGVWVFPLAGLRPGRVPRTST
jgi:5-methylthioadenosine/S-adenosylhomocysteine deaminase